MQLRRYHFFRICFQFDKTMNLSENYNVIYKYTCDKSPCSVTQTCYVGHTTATVKESNNDMHA